MRLPVPHRAAVAALLLAACGGAPRPEPAAAPARRAAPADARFMQGMILHHAQALRLTALLEERTGAEDLRLLGERIAVSQQDEIDRMRRWLAARGEPAPDPDDPHAAHAGHAAMPGMLTEAQFAELAAARGPAFERLFLERMIAHHEGALAMVERLLASDGAAQDAELAAFALDVNADQDAEIRRMRALAARR